MDDAIRTAVAGHKSTPLSQTIADSFMEVPNDVVTVKEQENGIFYGYTASKIREAGAYPTTDRNHSLHLA